MFRDETNLGVSAHFYSSATRNLSQEENHKFQVNLHYMGSPPKTKQREIKTMALRAGEGS